MIRVKNSFLEVVDDSVPRPRVRHRSLDVLSRVGTTSEPQERSITTTFSTCNDAVPCAAAHVDKEACNAWTMDTSERELGSFQSGTPLPSTSWPHCQQEPSSFDAGDAFKGDSNPQRKVIPVTSPPHPNSTSQSLQASAGSSAWDPLQTDTQRSSEVRKRSEEDKISTDSSPHPSSMPQPHSLQGSAASGDGNMHIDWARCTSDNGDNSHNSAGSSPCPPRASEHRMNGRFSGPGANAVRSPSMPDTWELVTDEPWEHVTDYEDPLSTANHSSKHNSGSFPREQPKNYPTQQTFPPENQTWDRLAARMTAQTDCFVRENQLLRQTCSNLCLLQEKMRIEICANDRAREVIRPLSSLEMQQVNRNIEYCVQVNRNLSKLAQVEEFSARLCMASGLQNSVHRW